MDIKNFRTALRGGGARGTLFEVQMTGPGAQAAGITNTPFTFMCKAAAHPSSDLGTIQVPYFGRFIKEPGDRIFPPWTVTVINDESGNVRSAFERLHSFMEEHSTAGNTHRSGPFGSNIQDYNSTLLVTQFDKRRTIKFQYQLECAFPAIVSDIPLAWEATDTIEEFTVTFEYDFFTSLYSEGPAGAR